MRVRTLAIALLTLAFMAGGTSLVIACAWGWPQDGGAGHHEYGKPGCGPDKTDGYAGESGRHTGQPPKDQDRGDCPHPPGQQCDDDHSGGSHDSYAVSYTTKSGSYSGKDDDCCDKSGSASTKYGSSGNKSGSNGSHDDSCSKSGDDEHGSSSRGH